MRSPVYTLEEINRLPEFGRDSGWFYGLVRHHETGRVGLYEILSGLGYCSPWPIVLKPKCMWWAIEDIYRATKRI